MRDGVEILQALDSACASVQAAGTELAKILSDFGEVKLSWDVAVEEELIRIYEEAIERGERPPAEDIRSALAFGAARKKHPELHMDYEAKQNRITALKSWVSSQKAVISGYQSLRRAET